MPRAALHAFLAALLLSSAACAGREGGGTARGQSPSETSSSMTALTAAEPSLPEGKAGPAAGVTTPALLLAPGAENPEATSPGSASPSRRPRHIPGVIRVPASSSAAVPTSPRAPLDPIVIPDCRLTVVEKEEVPSQREGVLLLVGTEVRPGEQVPPERLTVLQVGGEARQYRLLREGDRVEAGQLLALLDDHLARDDWAIKKARLAGAEAELAAAEKARDQAKERYQAELKLQSAPGGSATSEKDVEAAKLEWYKGHYDAITRKEALALAQLEVHQAETVLKMYEIHSTIPGIIKRVARNPGEAVKSLEPILEVRNPNRLRVEGLVEVEHLTRLRPGLGVLVEPTRTHGPLQTFTGHLQEITAIAVSKDPVHPAILSASEDGTVRVWGRDNLHEQRVLKHSAPVRALACTPPGPRPNLCLSGTADGSAWIWDLDSPAAAPLRELKGHQGAVACVAFSPDGSACVTGGEDREICLWETATGALRYRFPAGHLGAITSLQFASAARLVSAGRDNTVRVWGVGDGGAVLEGTFEHRSGEVARLGVRADGHCFLFDRGNALLVLSLPDGLTEGTLRAPSAGVNFASFALFAPAGDLVVTAGTFEGRLHLWRTPADGVRGYEVAQLVPPQRTAATCAAFDPSGAFLVSGTRDGQVLVWRLPPKGEVEKQFAGELTLVDQAVESNARQVRVCAELPNPEGLLLPGIPVTMTVDADRP